jgi:hypothetical protein
VKPCAIVNIYKYKWLHERHHFTSMVMEVCGAFRHNMDCFIKKCARLLHNRQLRDHLSMYFYI